MRGIKIEISPWLRDIIVDTAMIVGITTAALFAGALLGMVLVG
jgi:hypothetical protein